MQYEVTTPAEYFAALEDDWRRSTLMEIRRIIQEKGPDIQEGIQYKMLSYSDSRGVIFCLNAQRQYVSLYVGTAAKVDPQGVLLDGIDVGKGCIRFKKSTVVSETRIDEFIEKAIAMWRAGEDIDC